MTSTVTLVQHRALSPVGWVQKPKLDRFGSSPGDEDDVDTSADLSFLPGQLMIHGLLTVED